MGPASSRNPATPGAYGLRPMQPITEEFAQSIGVPVDQRIERQGGTRKIPSNHRYTPYVSCKWRSVIQAVTLLPITIQEGAEDMELPDPPNVELGDAAWFNSGMGREELRVHQGKYVIFVRADLLDRMDRQAKSVRIAEEVLANLNTLPAGPVLNHEASVFGGQPQSLCNIAKNTGLADLLPGPTAWEIPITAQNQVEDTQNPRPDPDYVGCTFAGTQRGSVRVTLLGPHGVKNRSAYYAKQTPVNIKGIEGFSSRDGIYFPYRDGAIEIETSVVPFDKALLVDKLKEIKTNILKAME